MIQQFIEKYSSKAVFSSAIENLIYVGLDMRLSSRPGSENKWPNVRVAKMVKCKLEPKRGKMSKPGVSFSYNDIKCGKS